MSKTLAEVLENNPPRLVILYRVIGDGEQFQWGVVGNMPLLSVIGRIAGIQSDMVCEEYLPECDQDGVALVITYDEGSRTMQHFVNYDAPREPLIGMLETIKSMLVDSRMGQHAASQKVQILGPDGRPIRL